MLLEATAEAELDLGPTVLEEDAQRQDCEAALRGFLRDLVDLVLVQQQLAGPLRLVGAKAVGVAVGGDMDSEQKDFAPFDSGVRVLELDLRVSQRLDLAAHQGDASLVRVDDLVVVAHLAVVGDDLAPAACRPRRRLPLAGVRFGELRCGHDQSILAALRAHRRRLCVGVIL